MMRRFANAAILIAAFSTVAQAQFQIGAGAGLNWAQIGDVELASITAAYESQQGWHAGLFIRLDTGPIAFRPGAYYMNAGKLFEGGFDDVLEQLGVFDLRPDVLDAIREQADFDVQFLSIPVDVVLTLPLSGVSPYGFVGPEFKLLTSSPDASVIADQLKTSVFAGNAGFGLAFSMGGTTFYPEVRFSFDLSSIVGDSIEIGGEEFTADEYLSSTFFFRLSAAF